MKASTFFKDRAKGFYAGLFGAPALLGLVVFVIIPFMMALILTFSNQKLLSPNDAEFVGLRNYDRLLAMTILVQKAKTDPDSGNVVRDDEGELVFPRIRDVTRKVEKYEDFRPFTEWTMGERRVVLLAKDPIFIQALLNTFLFAILVVPLQCGVALILALLVNSGIKGQVVFRTIYFSPVVMSLVVLSVLWVFLFNKDVGLINQFISWLSFGALSGPDWLGDPKSSMPAIAVMSAWQGAGFQMLIFLAGLQGIPKELYDAARIDGANGWQRFVNVTLPGLSHTITFVIVVTTIAAFGLFTQIDVMTQGGPQNSTTTVMFHAIQKGVREQDIGYGSTITFVYFIIISVIAILQQKFLSKREAR